MPGRYTLLLLALLALVLLVLICDRAIAGHQFSIQDACGRKWQMLWIRNGKAYEYPQSYPLRVRYNPLRHQWSRHPVMQPFNPPILTGSDLDITKREDKTCQPQTATR